MKQIFAVILTALILQVGVIASETAGEPPKHDWTEFDRLWNYNDPKASEETFKALLPEAEKSDNRDLHAQLLTQIARTQGLQGQFDAANAMLDAADKLLTDQPSVGKVRVLLERGRVLNSSGKPTDSKPLFIQAWKMSEGLKNDMYTVDALHMLGIVEQPEKQLEWSLKALDLVENSKDKRVKGWLGPMYNNIAWTYHDLKEYDKALVLFQKDVKWRQKIGDQNAARIARWSVGRTLRSLNRNDEAMVEQKGIEKELADLKLPGDGYNCEELGELYLLKGDKKIAQKYFGLAHEILSKDDWLVKNEPDRLARLKTLAQGSGE